MRIISIRKGFTSDHSSTSYEFLAVDKALGKKEKAEVASLSRRAAPTSRRVSFTYHVDGYDIPGGWENLMEKYYDVMYREEYGWWTLALAFHTTKEQLENLYKYEFSGKDDLGIAIESFGSRVVVIIYCRVDVAYIGDSYDAYDDYYGDENEEDEIDGEDRITFVAEDDLLNLLMQVRQQLLDEDYRTLYAVWEKYGGFDYDESDIPIPEDRKTGKSVVEQFTKILD